jgi:hypothetical protein
VPTLIARRRLYWPAVLLSVALLAGGIVVATLGYAATTGPDGVVHGYFAALARGDAATALAYGDVPAGPHGLLTADVLREQQRIAPLRDVRVVGTQRSGAKATVDVRYVLAFPGTDVPVRVTVPVHKDGDTWRLDGVAIRTALDAAGGRQRESILGGRVPTGPTLLFPGALPIRLDTPYLRLDPGKDNVSFDAQSSTGVYLEITERARRGLLAAVRAKLTRCVTGPPDDTCPLPDGRYVPGSIHGTIVGGLRAPHVRLESLDPAGRLTVSAKAAIAGSYRRLDFHNRAVGGRGRLDLDLHAVAYAVAPLTIGWTSS